MITPTFNVVAAFLMNTTSLHSQCSTDASRRLTIVLPVTFFLLLWQETCYCLSLPKARFRARVAYHGAGFQGFQLQRSDSKGDHDDDEQERTVQFVLEKALNKRFFGDTNILANRCIDGEKDMNRSSDDVDPDDHDDIPEDYVGGEDETFDPYPQVNSQRQSSNRLIKVVAAGRTDAGVHARGQAIHFDVPMGTTALADQLDTPQKILSIERSLNRLLPQGVCLWNLQPTPPPRLKPVKNSGGLVEREFDWNAMFDSTHKLYSYRLCLANVNIIPMDPLERHVRWQPDFPKPRNRNNKNQNHSSSDSLSEPILIVDPQKLQKLLKLFEGTHDFAAFCGAAEQTRRKSGVAPDTVRTVYNVTLIHEASNDSAPDSMLENNLGTIDRLYYYRIDFDIQGALYKQVRNMVGTVLDACVGRHSEEALRRLLMLDRAESLSATASLPKMTRQDNLSKPAPPQGLTLERVYFEEGESEF